jgi:hypothetical protein
VEEFAGLEERVAHFTLALRWMESFEFFDSLINQLPHRWEES